MRKIALRFVIVTFLLKVALLQTNVYIPEYMTWWEARQYCRKAHTDLSAVESWEDNEALTAIGKDHGSPLAWIWLRRRNDTWRVSEWRNASFFNWAEREPQYNCGAHYLTGWISKPCNIILHFYCFDSTMLLVKENKTWEDAMEYCRTQEKDLVSLPTEAALKEALKVGRQAQTDRVWTGLRYLADTWLWVKGETVKYKAWGQGEMPHCPAPTRRCGALSLKGGDHWESWDCADKLNFICQQSTDV